MGSIVFCVRDNKIGVPNRIVAVARPRSLCRRNTRGLLDCFESSFGSRETDEMFVEIVEPLAQSYRGVSCGIGCNKNELDLIGHIPRAVFQSGTKIRHVQGTLIGAMRITEKKERNRAQGSVPEIKRKTGGVGQNKSRFR